MGSRSGPKLDVVLGLPQRTGRAAELGPPRRTGRAAQLGPPRRTVRAADVQQPKSPSSDEETGSASLSSCVSTEGEEEAAAAGEEEEEVTSMVVVGCPRCFLYVMVAETNPRCPQCKSSNLLNLQDNALNNKK